MKEPFEVTDRNRLRRVAKRGSYDRDAVHRVIDAAWLGHVAIRDERTEGPVVIPMLHARMQDCLIFHGATSSRLMKFLVSGQPLAVSFALVDGLVLAKSLFHHSMNYRSVVAFGRGLPIEEEPAKLLALKAISDKIMPGRWREARQPNPQEMRATAVVQVPIDSASAKIRKGGPIDDPDDYSLPVWSGVVPFSSRWGEPSADEHSGGIALPSYIRPAKPESALEHSAESITRRKNV